LSKREVIRQRLSHALRLGRWTLSYNQFLYDMSVDPVPDFTRSFDATGIALIHIPKTGGTSLSHALYGRGIWHRRWDQIRDADPAGFTRWLKVSVVRDPIERFVSAYSYLKCGGSNEFDRFVSQRFLRGDVEQFVEMLRNCQLDHPVMRYWHFRPQAEFVLSSADILMVDRLIRFEQLEEGARTLGLHELPRLNALVAKPRVPVALSQSARSQIEKIYARDLLLYRQQF